MDLQFKKSFTDQIEKCFEEHFLPVIKHELDNETETMRRITQSIETFTDISPKENQDDFKIGVYKAKLLTLTQELWTKPKENNFNESHKKYVIALNHIIDNLDDFHYKEQNEKRFETSEGDSLILIIAKFIKKRFFTLSRTPLYITNLFKKEKKEILYWQHTIPVQKLAVHHFHHKTISEMQAITNVLSKKINTQYLNIKRWEESVTGQTIEAEIPQYDNPNEQIQQFEASLHEELETCIRTIVANRLEHYFDDYERSGTIELPRKRLSQSRLTKYLNKAELRWAKHNLTWANATYALFEEWRSDLEIHILKHKTFAEFSSFKSAQAKKLVDYVDPEINEIQKFIDEAAASISESDENLLTTLKKVNYQANKKLNIELVPRLCDKLSSQNIVNLVDKLEVNIRKSIEKLSNEYVIVRSNSYDQPIETDKLVKISCYELIAFNNWIFLEVELRKIKKELFHILERATIDTRDIDHVVTFSITSAITSFEEGKPKEEVSTIAKDGFTRALNRLVENRQTLAELIDTNNIQLGLVVQKFCDQIMELTVNENVSALRLRISKAKAAHQAKEVQIKLKANLKLRIAGTVDWVKKSYEHTRIWLKNASEKFILTASKPVLTKEVSDFLMESQLTIDKLPIIYRRLYKIEPLDDMELFEGRIKEFEAFKTAYDNWNQGRFAATAILGEKWGGLTSFINYVTKEAKLPFRVTRSIVKRNNSTEEGFIELMKSVFKNDTFENLDQVVDFLNQKPKRVVILEDLQNIYQRKVGGFSSIQLLFQLMSRTRENVFWVTSMTLHAWSYLSKTIHIVDFFSYTITLGDFTDDQIVNIIWKRNRISGFNIQFELSEENKKDKKFKSLEGEKQQEILKTKFFRELNKFAESNISLALTFWLLSTRRLDENTISIDQFQKPDLNFLSVLSANKIFVLHALIIHDGLSNSHVSQVLNMVDSQIKLITYSLLEDGIIIQKEDLYIVNPIIYRNVISMLTSKNLIH